MMLRVPALAGQAPKAAWAPRPSARPAPRAFGARGWRPCRAGGDEAGAGPALSLAEAFATLGLMEGASYDEVLSTKNRLLERAGEDMERKMQVEQAYDLIFSAQLKARLAGDLPVASNVRFADVQRRRPPPPPAQPPNAAARKAQQLLGNLRGGVSGGGGVVVAPPAPKTLTTAGAVFGVLAAWTLALAVAATVYLLREEKRAGLGKAVGLALGGLVLGTVVGSAVQGWLRVDIIPLGGLSSPGALVGEFSIAGLAAVALFLA